MPVFVADPQPVELAALIKRRRSLGQDRFDEVWDGVLHMNPAPSYEHQRLSQQLAVLLDPLARSAGLEAVIGGVNIGSEANYRIPDGGLHQPGAGGIWLPTAALVVEILSPDDETYDKLPFYAAHHVDEVVIVDPHEREVKWLGLARGQYRPLTASGLVDLEPVGLAHRIEWPEIQGHPQPCT